MKNQYKKRTFKCLGCGQVVTKRRAKNKTSYCSIDCWRKSKHPQRKTGKECQCDWCGKKVYKQKVHLLNHEHHFCSLVCANQYQAKDKLVFICKICGMRFKWSKSRIIQNNPLYCSWVCRLKDKEHIRKNSIKGNLVQQRKKGLNKLELAGRKILQELGVEFNEQVLMFDKFLVDVLLKNIPLIVQWDGTYWHNKPKRKLLDKSQDKYLGKCGYKVVRITDTQIKNDREYVCDYLRKTISGVA